MSSFVFLATNYEMPEVDNTNAKYITVKEAIDLGIKPHELVPWEKMDPNARILYVENEDDLNELVISKDYSYNVREYTSYAFIYKVDFIFTELRTMQFLEYLKANIKEGQKLEIWRVWIGQGDDELHIPYTRYSYEELSLNHLIPLFNWEHEKFKLQNCLVIER
ncbi:magnesium transporter [Falsibacillus albus]|uniref:Magnesium transporter n=1 Tax=Falsibacillus albus TaxID=2478915 RepID=A0A3L7JY02_9BACI|nr:magnesium transporter [Falsibacillus albus]RLQ94561.1 magnesium transporter [Falsibacillus albus]